MVQAAGTLSAIGQAFGDKNSKALSNFRSSIGGGGSGASAGDSRDMSELRNRIKQLTGVGR